MSNWTAASSDCSRPANNYVRVNTVDLYTPNARFTPERLGYQVLTLFGKLGYSRRLIRKLLETPGLVVPLHELGHGGADVLEGLKDSAVDRLLLERAIPPLRGVVA